MATKTTLLHWNDIDGGLLDSTQRDAVLLCSRMMDVATGDDTQKMLVMLDALAALMIYEIFTRAGADEAAAMHANHIMAICDRIDDRIAGRKP